MEAVVGGEDTAFVEDGFAGGDVFFGEEAELLDCRFGGGGDAVFGEEREGGGEDFTSWGDSGQLFV